LAARKYSTLSEIVGASVPKEPRAEGVQDNHDCSMEAIAEATKDMVLGEETDTIASEQQSTADREEEQYEVRQMPYLPS
jgi:hypothetical protein